MQTMNYQASKDLLTVLLLLFYCTCSFAGNYEYIFTKQVFEKCPMSATLGDLTWELSTNQPTTFNGFSHSTSKDHPGQRISTKEKVDLTLKTIGFARKVKSVTIYTSASNYVNCGVTVGSTTYKCNNNSAYPIEKTTKGYTFIGDGEGDITIIWKQQDKGCDIYIYKIKVDYHFRKNHTPPY